MPSAAPLAITRLNTRDSGFEDGLRRYAARQADAAADMEARVREIIGDVRERGDDALVEYAASLDGLAVNDAAELRLPPQRAAAIAASAEPETARALEQAADRIRRYAERQTLDDWQFEDDDGAQLGQRVTALESVGIYVPGGKAAYPSSVLMNAVPAQVAGVGRIVMTMPAADGAPDAAVMKAAEIAGVSEIYTLGGAHAVAALAYGTRTVAPVCKIVGPGNAWVAEAKRQVFGRVGVDMIAGPSEILVICDGRTEPRWIACDLFAQAEHDEQARAMLLCPDANYLDEVLRRMNELIGDMPRADIIRASLRDFGLMLEVGGLDEAVAIANRLAPEHLELSVERPEELLGGVRNAGAVFLGRHTSEVLGDYCAGPNHVLPTGGSARFFSPLGAHDFQKRTSVVRCTPRSAEQLGRVARRLARAEGLFAHEASARCRMTTR